MSWVTGSQWKHGATRPRSSSVKVGYTPGGGPGRSGIPALPSFPGSPTILYWSGMGAYKSDLTTPATAQGDSVYKWTDQSGNAHHALQQGVIAVPTIDTVAGNGYVGLKWATSVCLTTGFTNPFAGLSSMYAVLWGTDNHSAIHAWDGTRYWTLNTGSSGAFYGENFQNGGLSSTIHGVSETPVIVSATCDGSTTTVWVNASNLGPFSNTNPGGTIFLGDDGSSFTFASGNTAIVAFLFYNGVNHDAATSAGIRSTLNGVFGCY